MKVRVQTNSILNLLLVEMDLRWCTLVPRGESGFKNYVEYFVGLGPRKFGAKMVPHKHKVILTYFGFDS
jgi:hypothetical protein